MAFEFQFLDFLQSIRTPALDFFFKNATHLGDAGIVWIIMAIVLMIIPQARKVGFTMMLGLLLHLVIINGAIKPLVARVRPYDINTAVNLIISKQVDYSFPSGHAAASFTAVTVLYLCKYKRLATISLVLAVIIAFSRLYLYVHYPTDVIGGIIIGSLCGVAAWIIIEKLYERKAAREKV